MGTIVQMKLSDETLAQISGISDITGIKNRKQIVTQAISVYFDILTKMKDGKEIKVVNPEAEEPDV